MPHPKVEITITLEEFRRFETYCENHGIDISELFKHFIMMHLYMAKKYDNYST